jgi:hypothetical protein
VPNLQLAWDSTSSGVFKECKRKYYYAIVLGLEGRQKNVHLSFGIWLHEAKEQYDNARAAGLGHDDATVHAVKHIMCATWQRALARPWASDDPYKNRMTLVRTIVWYLEEYKSDPIETLRLANGRAAVELSFAFESPYAASSGEKYQICGHMHRRGRLGTETYVCDVKSTKQTLSEQYFSQFTPHNQFTIYTLASKVVWNVPTKGLIVDAAQVAVTFSRFERRQVYRDDSQLDEWLSGFGVLVREAEECARSAYWPMNEMACGNYGGCPFRRVCSHAPAGREQWIKSDFQSRTWDPLRVRGDI